MLACSSVGLQVAVADGPPPPAKPPFSPESEAKVGKEAAAEADKTYDRVDDKDALAKLQHMAEVLAANTPRPTVKYEVRLVKEKKPGPKPEINAFSLPGGIIYVTLGLLKDAQSDDELAGVLAHEITHNVYYDGLTMAKRASKMTTREIAAVLIGVLLGGASAGILAAEGMEFYNQGVLSGYSVEMEKRADREGVHWMIGTPWSPVGLLTFMERLAAAERRSVPGDPGIYRSHPDSPERAALLVQELEDLGIDINRRKVTSWLKPTAEERKINDKPAQAVVFEGQVIFACDSPGPGAKDAKERATGVCAALTAALADGAQLFDFTPGVQDGRPALLAYGQPLFSVQPADEALWGKAASAIVHDAHAALGAALHREALARLY